MNRLGLSLPSGPPIHPTRSGHAPARTSVIRAHAPGLGHVRSGCTSSDPPQAGPQVECIRARTSLDTYDPCRHSKTTTSSHSVTKESLTALPGPTPNGIPVTHTVPIHSFFLFPIYNPPLHLAVSSLSIALHFAPLFCNPAFTLMFMHPAFLSWPGFTGPHAHMTRHRARLLPPTRSRPLHQANAPCSRCDHPRLITARSLTTSFMSPPFRPGPAPAP